MTRAELDTLRLMAARPILDLGAASYFATSHAFWTCPAAIDPGIRCSCTLEDILHGFDKITSVLMTGRLAPKASRAEVVPSREGRK